MKFNKILSILVILFFQTTQLLAGQEHQSSALLQSSLRNKFKHEATPAELKKVFSEFKPQSSDTIQPSIQPSSVTWRPAEDTADYKFVLMSSEAGFDEVQNLRYKIAENLPEDVHLVLLVSFANAESIKKKYSKYISPERLILAQNKNISGGFWARDAFPFPLIDQNGNLKLTAAKYYRPFDSQQSIAKSLSLEMTQNNFTFVGGNLISDENANCFTIDSSRKFTTTEQDLKLIYGCKEVIYLEHLSGIGDVDEVLKPIGRNTLITNTIKYQSMLEQKGFKVILMPNHPNSYRTYVNSLIVGQTVFMPTYKTNKDPIAQKVYEDLGYRVVGIPSNQLSDELHGSIHCQTMAYPKTSKENLLQMLSLQEIH